MYCGDETGSYIGQIGSHSCQFGYGGEDNPKLVVPPYVASAFDSSSTGGDDENTATTSAKTGTAQRSWHVPTSCLSSRVAAQEVRSIMSMATHQSSQVANSSMNSNDASKATAGADAASPICDPNRFLAQGQVVEDWDAAQTTWQHGMSTLRAFHSMKHTKGGNGDQERVAEGVDGNCIHPVLAITPGFTEIVVPSDDDGGVPHNTTGKLYQESIRRKQQTQYTEMLLESLGAPAVFLASSPMLSAFSVGRQTALVVDIGAGGTRVTPVVDGLVLRTAQRRSGRGAHWLDHCTWQALLSSGSSVSARYQKKSNSAQARSSAFHTWSMQSLMYELRSFSPSDINVWNTAASGGSDSDASRDIPFMKLHRSMQANDETAAAGASSQATTAAEAIAQEKLDDADQDDVAMEDASGAGVDSSPQQPTDGKSDDSDSGSSSSSSSSEEEPPSIFELPDGTKVNLNGSSVGNDIRNVHELLFTDETPFLPKHVDNGKVPAATSTQSTLSNLPLPKLIRASLMAVSDVDVRKELASHIVLVGGTSAMLLHNALEQRLSYELTHNELPNFVKPKVIASKFAIERSASSWIGGSILTSLGSFQQLWLSKAEYEEYGAALGIQRFPDW